MVEFDNNHKAIIVSDTDYDRFVDWAVANGVEFQLVKTSYDAAKVYDWLPPEADTEDKNWNSSSNYC